MLLKGLATKLKSRAELSSFRLRNREKLIFTCPICRYQGPFKDLAVPTGSRRHAQCPKCGSLERHRIQLVVLERVLKETDPSQARMLHFAPEPFFAEYFSKRFGRYESADLIASGVDHKVDIAALPFEDASYDFVFASHVLEHVKDDDKAISEVRRILKPKGMAILPVPVLAEKTIEYPEPNPHETFHVRAPGLDYFDRYRRHFERVDIFSSETLPSEFQLFVFEDRSRWPTRECPLRTPMQGEKHADIVPVCRV